MNLTTGDTRLILAECKKQGLYRNQAAYVLATVQRETGGRMKPIAENLNYSEAGLRHTFGKYFTAAQAKTYAKKPEKIANRVYANRMGNGNEASGDGWGFRGRGYVQITGRSNYAKFGIELDPDEALNPETAAHILVSGMKNGTFTGKKLADYITLDKSDFQNARRIINALDHNVEIADAAKEYDKLLKAAGYGEASYVPGTTAPVIPVKPIEKPADKPVQPRLPDDPGVRPRKPEPASQKPAVASKGIWAVIVLALGGVGTWIAVHSCHWFGWWCN